MSVQRLGSAGPGDGDPRSREIARGSGRLKSPARDAETSLREAAAQFEAVFVRQMLAAMRSTVPDRGQAEELFSGMLDDHLAGVMTSRADSDLADAIYRQLIKGMAP